MPSFDSDGHSVPIITQPTKVASTRLRKVKAICDVDYYFRNIFKKTKYKGCQREIMDAAIEGLDICAVAPTGLGKSLCFQVPAVAEEHGITIVITPLLALMRNQVSALLSLNIETAAWCGDTPEDEQKEIAKDLQCGHPKLRLLYVTPERVQTPRFRTLLKKVYANNELARFVVDEAHCISTWGSNFRPAYRKLGELRDLCPTVPIMALTASAKQSMVEDMNKSLKLDPENLFQVIHSFNRRNLYYEVRYSPESGEEKMEEIIEFFADSYKRKIEGVAASKGEHAPTFTEEELKKALRTISIAGIVYCRAKNTCDAVANALRAKGFHARPFHKGLKQFDLDVWQAQWIDSERLAAQRKPRVDIIVATVAFGMGIDKSQCRFVIHFDLPTSFEGFYQETGRAGRDGQASRCILYYSREDAEKIKFLNANNRKNENYEAIVQSTNALLEYCESDDICRHVLICRYFGEKAEQSHKEEYCNRMCDVCKTMERNKSSLAPAEYIATQRQRLQDEATEEYHDRDQPDFIHEALLLSDTDDSNSDNSDKINNNFENNTLKNPLFLSSDGEDIDIEDDENFDLPPPQIINNPNSDVKDVLIPPEELMGILESDDADKTNNNDLDINTQKSSKKSSWNTENELPKINKDEIDGFTPQPLKYTNEIDLQLRKGNAVYLHRAVRDCILNKNDQERRKIWQILGYKHSIESVGFSCLKFAAIEIESDIFWRSKTNDGYREQSKSYFKALKELSEMETWDTLVDQNDEDYRVLNCDKEERQRDLIRTMRRSIMLSSYNND